MRFHIDLNNCPTTYLPWQRSIKHFLKHFQLLWISQKSSNFNSLQRDVARRRRNFEIFKKLLKFSSKSKMDAGPKFLRSNIFRAFSYVLEELSDRILSLAMRCKTPPEPGTDTTWNTKKYNSEEAQWATSRDVARRRPDGKSMILHYFPFRTKRLNNPNFWHG